MAPHSNGPRAMATLCNLALGLFAIHGITQIKQTVQSIGRNPPAPSRYHISSHPADLGRF